MDQEIRSGRLISYIFAIPCSFVTLILLLQNDRSAGLLMTALWFGLGATVGIYLLFNPKTLVRVEDENLELFPGSLFRNKKQIVVPLENIESFQVRTISDTEGSSCILSLYLREPQMFSREAMAWIRTSLPKSDSIPARDTTIHWSLTWPKGGSKGAEKKLEELTGCRVHR